MVFEQGKLYLYKESYQTPTYKTNENGRFLTKINGLNKNDVFLVLETCGTNRYKILKKNAVAYCILFHYDDCVELK